MTRKSFLLVAVCLLVAAVVMVLLKQHRAARSPSPGANSSAQGDGWARFAQWRATETRLQQLSTNNPAFQQWGREFALRVVNSHLQAVPLFGLKKAPLREEDIVVVSLLTQNGAQLWLSTKDRKHSFCYENGVLSSAEAHEAEMTGLFRDPSKIEHFADLAGPWSKEEAKRAAEALVMAKQMRLRDLGATHGPFVRAETFELPSPDGTIKHVTPFYTVTWRGWDDMTILEVRFRRTETGMWEPTYWFDNSRKTADTESTSYTNLYSRFFKEAKN